jgi:hypothetical protein
MKNWWISNSPTDGRNLEALREKQKVQLWQPRIRQSAQTTFKRKILKEEIESRCRLCKEYEETIDRLTSGCPILAKNEYIIRHDKVCTHLHCSICKTLGIETTENWYSHIPKLICQHEDITVLWNEGIQADKEVLANRPDIIIKNMKDKICLLTDVAIQSDSNVIQKESEKKLKYKNLSIEIQRMWNMKCFVIPVSIEATGIVTRGLKYIWKRYQESIQ